MKNCLLSPVLEFMWRCDEPETHILFFVYWFENQLPIAFIFSICRTYTYNNRRYGSYQPNGFGQQYPGQSQPGQYPGGLPQGDDRFKYDPVSI